MYMALMHTDSILISRVDPKAGPLTNIRVEARLDTHSILILKDNAIQSEIKLIFDRNVCSTL